MRRPLARLWIIVWAVTGGPPLEISSFAPSLRAKRSNPESRCGDSLDCFVASLLAMTRLLRRSRFASLLPQRLLHRPDRLGDGGLWREDGDELAADILQQHRVSIVVLAHLVELDALPGHDGLLARDVGGGQRVADLLAVGRLGAADGVGEDDQAHELTRGEIVEILARPCLEHIVDLADHRALLREIEREG